MIRIIITSIIKLVAKGNLSLLLAFLAIISSGNGLSGQTLEDYLVEAAENNPGLRAKYFEYQAALERVPQVGSLPDPQVGFGFFTRPMEFPMGDQRAELSLMQMFPWFGTLDAREDEASRVAWARYEAFRDAKNRLYYDVKSVWYDLYELEREIEIMNDNLDLLRELEELSLIRFQSSAPSSMIGGGMADVLRIRMEINEMENMLAMLVDTRAPLTAMFNKLLNRPANRDVAIADTLDVRILTTAEQGIFENMILDNPMIKMLDEEVAAFEARERIARMEGRPSFGAGLNYMIFSSPGMDDVSMGGRNMVMPMVTMTIPVYRGKYRAREREAKLTGESVLSNRENLANELFVQLSEVRRNLADAERRRDLFLVQADLAGKTMDILITDYSAGQVRFEEVLRLQEQLLDYRLEFTRAVADYNRSVARLDMLTARELFTNGDHTDE
jgi:outer membrane protein TolC